MSEDKRVVELDEYEHRAVVNIINDRRTDMIKQNKDNEYVTSILMKVIKAPLKKKSLFKREKIKYER